MEGVHNLTTEELTGGQEHLQPEPPQQGAKPKSLSQPQKEQQTASSTSHDELEQRKQSRRHNPERKRLRHQRQSIDSDTAPEPNQEVFVATKAKEQSPTDVSTQAKPKALEDKPKQKRERKPQRPGKYVCTYCGRPCAKPSVLQKHIRSHTGERPYPCAPCGFSFKTKSNLYKHRKSHTHRVKAGLALGEQKSLEEQVTESDDESKLLSAASSLTHRQSNVTSMKGHETDRVKDCSGGNSDSYAVKKRLALRLSRGKHVPQNSADEKTSSLVLDSRGSTESGYFSRSESTEQTQDSPPNTSAKSYAEIILGKYGRLGHLPRMSNQHTPLPSGQEEKNLSFTVPKKQVIDHITKLITINEAVVDTSKIDSVKPRRFSLSRKNSSESQKGSNTKEVLLHSPKAGDLGYKSTGSISMGVPCEKFHQPPTNVEKPVGQISTGPLVRSHSLPSAGSSFDTSGGSLCKFRQSQSFDDQPSETQTSRRYRTLRRQPAIEIPLGTELIKEDQDPSQLFYPTCVTTMLDLMKPLPQPFECDASHIECKDWESYKKHKQSLCHIKSPHKELVVGQMQCSQLSNLAVRAGTSTIRKRRKEESFEFDDPSSSALPFTTISVGPGKDKSCVAIEGSRRPSLQTCSVIQHTSSFEKQEVLYQENQNKDDQLVSSKDSQQQTKLPAQKLVRQNNVKVPEILVTEDPSVSPEISADPTCAGKNSGKPEEFQWPQRSPSLAQLPIEKLPPKKKRLRLAEAAQSSGESSFDSASLPRSPSQDSSASYASSRSTSFEEPNRPDMEVSISTPLRRSRAPHMLTVPGEHQHREMRRSASEQAPHDPQPSILMSETRSKSFDYSCLSPERSAVGWKERRKCLLMRHAAIRDQDDEGEHLASLRHSPEHVNPSRSSPASPSPSTSPASKSICAQGSQSKESSFQWKLNQNTELLDVIHVPSVKKETCCKYKTHKYGLSGAARAHYLPMSTGLKLEIPSRCDNYSERHTHPSAPHITSSSEILTPLTSPAVAVRLQTNTLTPACAIYTTMSQSTSPMPQEALDAVSPSMGLSTSEHENSKNVNSEPQPWLDDSQRSSASGGNKRMLSPSNSMELHPESQQQQKRVKEEEDKEKVEYSEATLVDKHKQQNQPCFPELVSTTSHPLFPSLLSSTCNSWCYLNYIKPNPSTLDEQKPSVYSSWSTSGYNPNPPGLSSKTVLSLLHCKQRLSPSIYTTSPMSVRTTESMEQEDDKRPSSCEVYNSPSNHGDQEEMEKGQSPANKSYTREGTEEKQEEDIRHKKSPERRSNTETNNDEDDEDHQCEGSRLYSENLSERPPCTAAEKFKESTEAENQTSSEDAHRAERVVPQDLHHQSSAPETRGQVQDGTSKIADSDVSPGCSTVLPATSTDSPRKCSAGARRALFARRRLNASESPESPRSGRAPSPSYRPSSPAPHADSPVPGLSSAPAGCRSPCPQFSEQTTAQLADSASLMLVSAPSSRPRGPPNLLSHLPLHSQQPSRPPSLLIPIGGIHMIQPRSHLPLYRLATTPTALRGKGGASVSLATPSTGDPPQSHDEHCGMASQRHVYTPHHQKEAPL